MERHVLRETRAKLPALPEFARPTDMASSPAPCPTRIPKGDSARGSRHDHLPGNRKAHLYAPQPRLGNLRKHPHRGTNHRMRGMRQGPPLAKMGCRSGRGRRRRLIPTILDMRAAAGDAEHRQGFPTLAPIHPLPVRLPDRNGGFPRAFGQGADGPWLSDGAHGLRCPATPRHARLAESLGKPSPWPARIPTRTNAPRPTPACRAEARQSEKTARRRHRRPLRPARAQRNSSRSTGLAAAWLEKLSDCGPRLLTAAKSRARSQK